METIKKQLNDISSYTDTNGGVKKFLKNNFQDSIEIINVMSKFNDQYIADTFNSKTSNKAMRIIWKSALHLLSNSKYLKTLECKHLYKIGLLTIKIMHNKHIGHTTKNEFCESIFLYRYHSNNLTECLVQHIQSITDSSSIQIICLWLDIVVHYQHIVREQQDDFEYSYFDPRKIISECIIKQKYNLPNDLRLRGSFLFYLTYIPYPHLHPDEKLASICRHHILSQMKDLDKWTSATVHCAMGSICLMTTYYSEQFKFDEIYYHFLLYIITYEKFQQMLVSTWRNDETILIHTITNYFYNTIDNNENMKVTLGTALDKLNNLYKNVKYESTKMNICYLILISAHEKSVISDEIIIGCFQHIKRCNMPPIPQEIKVRSICQYDQNRVVRFRNQKLEQRKNPDKFLHGLKHACQYDSVKDAIIRLKKIDELADMIEGHSEVVCDILALLSTKTNAQKILKENSKFCCYMDSQTSKIKVRQSNSLKFEQIANSFQRERLISPHLVKEKVVLSCSDTKLSNHIKHHLKKVGHDILVLNEYKNEMEKEEFILKCKCMLVCLTNNYSQYQSDLIFGYKNQVKIILIIIENEQPYCPNEPFLKFILKRYSSSLIRTNIDKLDKLYELLSKEIERLSSTSSQKIMLSSDENNKLKGSPLQAIEKSCTAEDLYKACKENYIDKVKQYLQNTTNEVLDESVFKESTALHIASYNGHDEIVRLLLKVGASRCIRNYHNLTAFEEARTQSTKDLFQIKSDNNEQNRFINNDIYTEWTTAFQDPLKKRKYLRRKLYELREHDLDGIHENLMKYMHIFIDTLPLANQKKQIVKQFFLVMRKKVDPIYIIGAYTSATCFHKYYNEYIAQHAINFFDSSIVDIHVNYKIVKYVVKSIAILMFHWAFNQYRYSGKTYRGMLMTKEDLYKYVVNSKIMNKSFLSTSKSNEIAECFSGCLNDENNLRKTRDKQAIQTAVLCTYIIKNSETALSLETISRQKVEEEVLILPFSVFEVKSVRRTPTNTIDILLEEVLDESSEKDN
ncbi:hypothetical protein I4U23_016543 [Adineta vaga]|nr:hypothetical protein I4U23_016543 [Adineta vaga]